jgi:hypothetical protein
LGSRKYAKRHENFSKKQRRLLLSGDDVPDIQFSIMVKFSCVGVMCLFHGLKRLPHDLQDKPRSKNRRNAWITGVLALTAKNASDNFAQFPVVWQVKQLSHRKIDM